MMLYKLLASYKITYIFKFTIHTRKTKYIFPHNLVFVIEEFYQQHEDYWQPGTNRRESSRRA